MADADSSTFDSQSTSHSGVDEFAPYDDIRRHAHDDLVHLAEDLGLQPDDNASSDALRALIAARIELLRATPIEVLRELVVWGGRSAPTGATRMSLAREIRALRRFDYDTLSHDALVVLAQLCGITVDPKDHAEKIINRLNEAGGFWGMVDRKRRKVIGRFLEKIIDGVDDDDATVAQAQAESAAAREKRLRKEIESHGVVGGIANRLRGAADSYIETKLDEIELRIDAKLAEIDRRLAEWRDREIANRLKILRLTLAFTLVVALLSLGYNYLKSEAQPSRDKPAENVARQVSDIND